MVEGSRVVIVGVAESLYSRHPPEGVTTEWLLADEFARVLARTDLRREDLDGLGVAAFTLATDRGQQPCAHVPPGEDGGIPVVRVRS